MSKNNRDVYEEGARVSGLTGEDLEDYMLMLGFSNKTKTEEKDKKTTVLAIGFKIAIMVALLKLLIQT